jgi:hypothetical protein
LAEDAQKKKFSATVPYLPDLIHRLIHLHAPCSLLTAGEPSCERSSRLILLLFHDLFLFWLNDSD